MSESNNNNKTNRCWIVINKKKYQKETNEEADEREEKRQYSNIDGRDFFVFPAAMEITFIPNLIQYHNCTQRKT